MHAQGEVGDLKSGCSGRWEVKYLWDVQRGGIFNVFHAGCIDLFWNDLVNHLVRCTV